VTLQAVARPGRTADCWLVFLHGFSGDDREWQPVGETLGDYSRLYVNLPGHGASGDVATHSFATVCAQLKSTLLRYNIRNYWLVGYSLGGRVAMYFACCESHPGLNGIVVEGGHPGLQDEAERRARLSSDEQWAQRFAGELLSDVFDDWYRQPVFASLDEAQRQALVQLRARNNGPRLADMLLATSLAVQPDLRASLAARDYAFWYLCGERDPKFRAIAQALGASCHLISHAGHNAHRENPGEVAERLAQIVHF